MAKKAVARRKNAGTVLGFMDWVGGLRDDPKIRLGFEKVLQNSAHPHYASAMKLMLAYAEGTPIKRMVIADLTPQRQETGQQVSDRVWSQVLQLAATNPLDRRVQVLAAIQGAEAKLQNAEPVEVL